MTRLLVALLVGVLILFPYVGWAAITVGNTTSSSVVFPGAGTLTFSVTTESGTDLLLVCATGTDGVLGNREVTAVTFNGTGMTRVTSSEADNSNFLNASLWYTLSPTITTANVVVTAAFGVDTIAAGATRFSGVDQTTPFGTAAIATGSSATASVGVSSGSSDVVVGCISSDSQAGITETGTLLWEIENSNSDTSAGAQRYAGTGGTVTVQWSQTNTGWAVSGVSVKPASGGGGPDVSQFYKRRIQ